MARVEETEVWCAETDDKLGLGNEGDCWMPIAFDWNDVLAVKEAGPNDFIGKKMATIYIVGVHFIINMTHTEAVYKFKINREE